MVRALGRRAGTIIALLLANSVVCGQTTITCERVDTDDQVVADLRVETTAASASSPYSSYDYDSWFISADENYATWAGACAAMANSNESHSLIDVLAENPTVQGDPVDVPQITMGIGANIESLASPSDANGHATARWAIDPQSGIFDPNGYAVARGTYEVLGNNETGILYGMIDIIISISETGNWDFQDDDPDEWQITCGGSYLHGNWNGDGWTVTGVLKQAGGDDVPITEYWGLNVNEIIYVSEEAESGDFKHLEINIPRMDMVCWADHDGETASAVVSSFSFGTSFEVESDP